jgi:predicted acyltransferase (DUF342 family)
MSTRRPRKAITEGNVVRLGAVETADSILADVQAKGKVQQAEISRMLQDLNASMQARREIHIQELVRIARALDGQGLHDLIEVARRLAGWEPQS